MSCLDYYNRLLTGLPILSLFWSVPPSEWLSMTQLIISVPCLQFFHGAPSSWPRVSGHAPQRHTRLISADLRPITSHAHGCPSIPNQVSSCSLQLYMLRSQPQTLHLLLCPWRALSWGSLLDPLSAPTLCIYASLHFWLHCDCQVLSEVMKSLGHPSYEDPDYWIWRNIRITTYVII